MADRASDIRTDGACMTVTPGVCGFACRISVEKSGRRQVSIDIADSRCNQIQRLSEQLTALTLKELFLPLTRNPVYQAAEKAGCHPSCVIPAAVLKTAEVAMGMAVAQEVAFRFDCKPEDI